MGLIILAQTPSTPPGDEVTKDLTKALSQVMDQYNVPGLSAVVILPRNTPRVIALGHSNRDRQVPVTPGTRFRIGSISKMFVGLAALKLSEEGRLALDTPLRTLAPELTGNNPWEATAPVRVIHLLEHTTGWDDLHLKEFASNDARPLTLQEGLALCPKARTSRWRPGSHYSYCNSGPAVLARVIEKLTGMEFEKFITESFFRPIGMSTATYFLPQEGPDGVTTLYHADGRTPFPYRHLSLRPAGAVNASALDMAALLRFFLERGSTNGSPLLSQASISRMTTTVTTNAARAGIPVGWGMHNRTMPGPGGRLWHGHGGTLDGGLSDLAYLPDEGRGYYFSINSNNNGAFRSISRVLAAFSSAGLESPDLPVENELPQDTQSDWQGWYQILNPRNELAAGFMRLLDPMKISFQGQHLILTPLSGAPIRFVHTQDRLFRRDGEHFATVALLGASDSRELSFNGKDFQRVSGLIVGTRIALFLLIVLTIPTILLHSIFWSFRWIVKGRGSVVLRSTKLAQMIAGVCCAVAGISLVLGGRGDQIIDNFGRLTIWSVTLCVCSWGFALASFAALVFLFQTKPRTIGLRLWIGHLTTSLLMATATICLALWGLIGFRSWS